MSEQWKRLFMFGDYLKITTTITDIKFWRRALHYQFVYSVLGLLLGLACILSGVTLYLHGVTGNTKSWTASILGLKSSVSDMPAGAVLFVTGFLIVYITRYIVEPESAKQRTAKRKKAKQE